MATCNKPTWDLSDPGCGNELQLFECAIMEFVDITGIPIDYYILDPTLVRDTLYGESTETNYYPARRTKVVYEPTEEVSMTNTFGIVSEEMIQYAEMPKSTFSRDVTGAVEPKPGDVIRTLWNDRSYEVVDVGEEGKIFKLNKLSWEFILKPFRFSATDDTGLSDALISSDIDSTLSDPLTAYGDNVFIEEESDEIDLVTDSSVYGY
jgi:hypothetical protein